MLDRIDLELAGALNSDSTVVNVKAAVYTRDFNSHNSGPKVI